MEGGSVGNAGAITDQYILYAKKKPQVLPVAFLDESFY
jgi:hypothetical protein